MNTRVVIPVVALAVVLLIVVMSSIFTVHQTENALVLQFGYPVRPISEPGLHFKVPLVQNVAYYDKRILDVVPSFDPVDHAERPRLDL